MMRRLVHAPRVSIFPTYFPSTYILAVPVQLLREPTQPILIAIGLRLLKIRELRTANFLPALVVAPLLVGAVALWQMYASGALVWPFH